MNEEIFKEKYEEVKILEEQIKKANKDLAEVEEQLEELNYSIESIKNFELVRKGNEVFVPLMNGVFVKARIEEPNQFLVNVGKNVVAPKTLKEVIDMFEKQKKYLMNYKAKIEAFHNEANLKMYQLQIDIGALIKEYEGKNV
jgi:prefoldin alpha subunit